MASRDGLTLAHDLLEHQNGAAHIGTVWDELEALGGIWQVRGRTGDMLSKSGGMYSPAYHVGSDIARMWQEWIDEGDPPHKHRVKRTRPHLYDDDFAEIIEQARHDILNEADEAFTDSELTLLDDYLGQALHRLRMGFRKAERRFGSNYTGHNLFRVIRDACARAPEYEGQEARLSYSLDDGRAYLTELYGED